MKSLWILRIVLAAMVGLSAWCFPQSVDAVESDMLISAAKVHGRSDKVFVYDMNVLDTNADVTLV